MSVDTRTPRGYPMDEPVLNTVKVPCDPAQVIVNHASFRVLLPSAPTDDTAPLPSVPVPVRDAGTGHRRPLVWTGRSTPGNPGASTLLQAVRAAGVHGGVHGGGVHAGPDAVTTQVLPRVHPGVHPGEAPDGVGDLGSAVIGPRPPQAVEHTQPLPAVRAHEDAADGLGGLDGVAGVPGVDGSEEGRSGRAARPGRSHRARQAFYPGRRMSLGGVLLPLRVLLGFIALYAGMGKLTDPVYFDGGERGSLFAWLDSLKPWSVAAPLHDWALAHPVGAGLAVAFTQIIVGVLTIFGLWQRLAAVLGAALSLALLVTVSWRQVPAYETPDVIMLAAWSPLIIAGAPVYSLDARLAGEAWRKLGPRAPLGELRRRVLRRGSAMATLLLGLALLIGSMLGSAVRSSQLPRVSEPGEPPVNHLPGEPLPERSAGGRDDAADPSAGSGSQQAGPGAEESTAEPEAGASVAERGPQEAGRAPGGGLGGAEGGGSAVEQTPTTEQTVPAPKQSAPASQTPGEESPTDPVDPGTGTGEEPPEESVPSDEGGEQSSPGPLGGLLG
ncbi:DoxX family membrane protein [Streptomyces sp. 6N223]|uniref:DoxX family membrane protein n=1 Tax=Streptomyces sp. 6N223 TaxID=3457412 RepID=UPI003FD54EBA